MDIGLIQYYLHDEWPEMEPSFPDPFETLGRNLEGTGLTILYTQRNDDYYALLSWSLMYMVKKAWEK